MNQLLGRQNRLRVDAEIVRDRLSASGKLSPRLAVLGVSAPTGGSICVYTEEKELADERG